MMHPRFEEAQGRLSRLGRHIRCRLSRKQKRTYAAMFHTALEKDERGDQAVRLIDDLIEQNRPLKW
ncbi:hypothetical protein [Bradyrhizobium sp. SZCCHNPS1003]|uniref:hypothetical protein n=2 Tax=unclassified Bradyrhizobium TaxID=2631580 RepID=UPI0028E47A0C|nr:hypothetical protein [Bradyrhizobium sp. SZCCHNPS1003]